MSEENTQVKISMPLIDDIELHRIDNFYNDIVSEYTKAFVKEKEQVIAQRLMMNLQQENKQLKEELKYTVPIVEHNKIVSEKNKENQQLKEVINKAKLKSIYLQERYGYILDDLTFLLSNVEGNNDK